MAYDNTMKIEFYKPKYNLDIKFDGDDSFDLLFKNVSGELFFSADVEDYDAYVSFEDEECKFTNGELVAKVNISDLMETIANGQLRNTNGTTYGEWIPRIVGDYKTEHDLVFDGKTYADRGYWELFFKEMSKDEIKDFIEFCRDYISIPNLEFSSRDFSFDKDNVRINSHGYSITINDDYTIEMAEEFTCKSLDTIGVWEMNHDYGDEFEESKKSTRKSLKESNAVDKNGPYAKGYFAYKTWGMTLEENPYEPNTRHYIAWNRGWNDAKKGKTIVVEESLKEEKVTDSLFEDVVFSMIKKFKLKKEYDVERPSWYVFNFRNKNKDAQFGITLDKYNDDSLYGDVLAFGDEKDDIFKYKTDEIKVDSYNIEKECMNIIADCLAFIDTNKKITIFESKKFDKKNLKEEAITTKLFRFIQDLYDVHYITEEQLNKFQKHDFSKKEIKVLEQNYEIYKTSNEFDEINDAIKSTVNMINSFKENKITEKKIKMDVWEWGEVKGTDEEFCNHIVSYAEENNIEYMEITEEEFDNLKNEYLMKTYGNKGIFNKKSIKESVEFYNDFGTGVYCATSSNGWTFCYCPLSWINKKGMEDLIGWSVMDDKAHYIDGDGWENKTDEEINNSIDNFEKLIKKYAKEDAKEIIKDFRSTLVK